MADVLRDVNGTHYAGEVTAAMRKALDAANGSGVVARCVSRFNDDTGEVESKWYPVNTDQLAPGPLPGEYRTVVLADDIDSDGSDSVPEDGSTIQVPNPFQSGIHPNDEQANRSPFMGIS